MTSPLKIAVLASHGGSNMQAIIDAIEGGELSARIVLVISNNSTSGALERAHKHGLPWKHISSATHPTTHLAADAGEGSASGEDRAICEALREAGADLVLLAGYMKKIGPATLAAFRGRILNIHPALLPKHGGPGMYGIKPHEAALAEGDAESGATVHVIEEEYDRGRILRQERVPILQGDTAEMLQKRVLEVEHRIYAAVVKEIVAGRITLPAGEG